MNRTKIIQYSISFLIIIGIFFLNAFLSGLFSFTETPKIIGEISDGFIIPGVLFIDAGILTWVNKEEFFDMIGYAFSSLWTLFSPSEKTLEKRKTYNEYKKIRDEKGRKWYPFLLISGLITLFIGIVFFIIYLIIS